MTNLSDPDETSRRVRGPPVDYWPSGEGTLCNSCGQSWGKLKKTWDVETCREALKKKNDFSNWWCNWCHEPPNLQPKHGSQLNHSAQLEKAAGQKINACYSRTPAKFSEFQTFALEGPCTIQTGVGCIGVVRRVAMFMVQKPCKARNVCNVCRS